jgi:hypothetical protein
MRILLLLLLLFAGPLGAGEGSGRADEIQGKIAQLRASLKAEAEALEELQESGWWNLVSRRRKEMRLRRLRLLKMRIDHLERELAELKNP